jgi:Zn-dependent peptidase ImmA (M78 family)
MKGESVDESDLENDDLDLGIDGLRQLEWQANYFASCLLVPRDVLAASALRQALYLDLRDRGHGLIFVDAQPANIENYYLVTTALMKVFAVSRTTIDIRLKALGLLNDSRPRQIEAGRLSRMGNNFWTQAARGIPPSLQTY